MSPAQPAHENPAPAALHIILLDDGADRATDIEGALASFHLDFQLNRVDGRAHFLSALADPPDAVISASIAGGYPGLEALCAARALYPELPFIFCGTPTDAEAVAAWRAGADDYIFLDELDRLPAALERAVARRMMRARNARRAEEIEGLNSELLQLVRHVDGVRDEEKKRLAREIHDQLGQELTAHKLGLYWIQRELAGREDAPLFRRVLDKLSELIDLNSTTIATVRSIAHQMRPVVLDEMGLVPALESLVRDFNRQGGALCGLRVRSGRDAVQDANQDASDNFAPLSPALETDLFRIAQEALTNIGRHSKGQHAYIQLTQSPGDLLLEIGDDGVGYATEDRPFGLGLIGIRERIRAHGGQIEIDSTPGRGTSIRVRMQLD
jgi:signal transduction histidine kinase